MSTDTLVWILSQIPSLYIMTTSVLMCWGAFIIFALSYIINLVKHSKNIEPSIENEVCSTCTRVRRCDQVHLMITSATVVLNFFSLLITPVYLSSIMDILLISNIWVVVYYSFLTFTSLKHFHKIYLFKQVREHDRQVELPEIKQKFRF